MATDANTWAVREHQPLHLHALEALACFCGDPDVSLCKSLLQGVPTGYNNDIPVSNCFWPNQKENLEDVSLSIHMQNWRSASVDPSVTQALLCIMLTMTGAIWFVPTYFYLSFLGSLKALLRSVMGGVT